MFNQNLKLLNVYELSRTYFENLCSCVFCFDFEKTRKCSKCEKLYCKNHRENHPCFTKFEVWN